MYNWNAGESRIKSKIKRAEFEMPQKVRKDYSK